MKIYDKEMYSKEQSITTVIYLVVVFLVGFFTGYIVSSLQYSDDANTVQDNEIENVQTID